MAQQAEHVLGKDEVIGSNPVNSSKKIRSQKWTDFLFLSYNITTKALQSESFTLYMRKCEFFILDFSRNCCNKRICVINNDVRNFVFNLFSDKVAEVSCTS